MQQTKTHIKQQSIKTLKIAMKTNNNTLTKTNGHRLNGFTIEDIGDDHLYTGLETPMKSDAFKLSDEEKKERIAILFEEIMDVMGLDLNDDSFTRNTKTRC